jgi:2-dehydropantoate 2-reductase
LDVVVFGAGATGSVFGALLARAGHGVRLVGRAAHVRAIREHGLRLEGSVEGSFSIDARETLDAGAPPDVILLTVKTPDLEAAADAISEALPRRVPVLALENGLGVQRRLEERFHARGWKNPEGWIRRAVHTLPATWLRPGVVRYAGTGEVLLGSDPPEEPDARAARYEALFRSAGIPVRTVDDLDREIWRKTLVNAAINPVTADHGVLNGQLAKEPWRRQALDLLEEARHVAAAEGFEFTAEEAERELWRVVRATARNQSSMLQDVLHGRETEIASISGALLAFGTAHGLSLPATRRVAERIRRRASAARGTDPAAAGSAPASTGASAPRSARPSGKPS